MEVPMPEFLSRNTTLVAGACVVALVVAAGGFYWVKEGPANTSAKTISLADSDVCALAVTRAQDYGALPFDARKLDTKTVDTANPNRVTCGAQSASAKFTLTADVACDDAKNAECLVLQKVTHENGTALYDTQI
jgi:hypothetical protein